MSNCRRGEHFNTDNGWNGTSKEYVHQVKVTGRVTAHCTNCGDVLNRDERAAGVCSGGCFNHDGSAYE